MSKTILLVDDEPHVLEVLRVTLEDLGFNLLEASDGTSALGLIRSGKPDLVILDVMMPNLSGLEICEQIRDSDDPAKPVVILLSAKSADEEAEAGFKAGASRYLTKPFSPLTLLTEVVKVLDVDLP